MTEPLVRARFVDRPSRFLVRFRRHGGGHEDREGIAHLPTSGRLEEILLPGATELLLAPRPHTHTGYEALGAVWSARWPGDEPRVVFLNATRMNAIAARLIEERAIPELADLAVDRAEAKDGRSRFDFLLKRPSDDSRYLLEVKSVTLTEHGLAMFPDAATDRGRRHLLELSKWSTRNRSRAGVLFLAQGPATRFLPHVHEDLAFARALLSAREKIDVLAYGLDPKLDEQDRIRVDVPPRALDIPWSRLDTAARDSGLYLLVLELPRARVLEIGALGPMRFPRGSYVYVGSARRSLTKRVDRHLRKRKRFHWHIDFLRDAASRVRVLPIRGAATSTGECDLARAVEASEGGTLVPRFGCSDCGCGGHLIHFADPPVRTTAFQSMLARARHQLF